MAIQYHPEQGTIVVCDFDGFVAPEMVKRDMGLPVGVMAESIDVIVRVLPRFE